MLKDCPAASMPRLFPELAGLIVGIFLGRRHKITVETGICPLHTFHKAYSEALTGRDTVSPVVSALAGEE